MSSTDDIIALAATQARRGRTREAQRILRNAVDANPGDAALLRASIALHLETGSLAECATVLEQLIEQCPHDTEAHHTLAGVLNALGRDAMLPAVYRRLLAHAPEDALAHFNLACCLRRQGELEPALREHAQAIRLGIDRPEEAWTNIGVIHGELQRHAEARDAFERAISLNPRWIPALYDLALWHEEHGDPATAAGLLERVLGVDPGYHDALARLAHLDRVRAPDDPLVGRLQEALRRDDLAAAQRESLHFALGKVFDECRQYDRAFAHYCSGNELARLRAPGYSRAVTERLFEEIATVFSRRWLETVQPVSQAPLLFICGMYRSGSTLLEQMLCAHPDVQAGGELGWFSARIPLHDARWPRSTADTAAQALRDLAGGYLEHLAASFPGARVVTNKRPENFLLLGLLHGLFPNARFVHTVRDARDTVLAVYFQQLDSSVGYANDTGDIAHYLGCHDRLMAHWHELLPARLLDVRYEELVRNPMEQLQRVCAFTGLQWTESMLDFAARSNRVRTASVWQVRQPLYTTSIGRWRNYAPIVGDCAWMHGGALAHE